MKIKKKIRKKEKEIRIKINKFNKNNKKQILNICNIIQIKFI